MAKFCHFILSLSFIFVIVVLGFLLAVCGFRVGFRSVLGLGSWGCQNLTGFLLGENLGVLSAAPPRELLCYFPLRFLGRFFRTLSASCRGDSDKGQQSSSRYNRAKWSLNTVPQVMFPRATLTDGGK